MYFVPPTSGEHFYLQTLLTVVKGPKFFKDLCTYQGQVYNIFQEACLAHGLFKDNNEWEQCLCKASAMQTSFCLHQLFATFLLFCNVSEPHCLWQQFHQYICNDLLHHLQTLGFPNASKDQVYNYRLHLLDKQLQESGLALADWPTMPKPIYNWDTYLTNLLIADQLNYNHVEQHKLFKSLLPTLNNNQRIVYNVVIDCVKNYKPKLFFVDGPGRTGKTYIYYTICSKLRTSRGNN